MDKKIPLSKIAALVEGEIVGDSNKIISGAAPFEHAGSNEITVAASAKYLKRLGGSQAAAILVPRDTQLVDHNLVQVDNPMVAFAKVMQYLILVNQRAYVITFTTDPGRFDDYVSTFDQIMQSFHFDEVDEK